MKTNYWESFHETQFYHIYNRGNNKGLLFFNESNKSFFLNKWKRYLHPYLELYAYVLMPNHFHFLVKVKQVDEALRKKVGRESSIKGRLFLNSEIDFNTFLIDQFKRFFSAYTLAVNKQQNRVGSLFQKRFKRVQVNNEAYLLRLIAYIHHNPIHHHYSKTYDQWKHSSYNQIVLGESKLVNIKKVYELFSDALGESISISDFHSDLYSKFKEDINQSELIPI